MGGDSSCPHTRLILGPLLFYGVEIAIRNIGPFAAGRARLVTYSPKRVTSRICNGPGQTIGLSISLGAPGTIEWVGGNSLVPDKLPLLFYGVMMSVSLT